MDNHKLGKLLQQPRDGNGYAVRPVSYYTQWRSTATEYESVCGVNRKDESLFVTFNDPNFSMQGKWTLQHGCWYVDVEIVSYQERPCWSRMMDPPLDDNLPYFAYFMNINVITDRIAHVSFTHSSANENWYDDMIGYWNNIINVGNKLLYKNKRITWSRTSSVLETIHMIRKLFYLTIR